MKNLKSYWIVALARYILALGIFRYGVLKLFSLQFPYPSLSDLNTAYGDFLPWKIYNLTLGYATAGYQPILGILEIAGVVLLLFRRTATFGAAIIFMILVNVVAVNFAYQLGNHLYAIFLLLLSIIVLAPDLPRLFRLLVLRRPTTGINRDFPAAVLALIRFRAVFKSGFIILLLAYGVFIYIAYTKDNWPFTAESRLGKQLQGVYRVASFRLNNHDYPEAERSPNRWQELVFEKWNTVSIRRPGIVPLDSSGEPIDYHERKYEYLGNGGRVFFSYSIDSIAKELRLVNKQDSLERYKFSYSYSPDSVLQLTGSDNRKQRLQIGLVKIHKRYLLKEGRRKEKQKFQ